MQKKLVCSLIALAVLAFVVGVIGVIFPAATILNIMPESFSRGSNNLALLAIAMTLCWKKD